MFTPQNEQGVVLLFGALAGKHEWQVVSIQSAYPDAVLRDGNGEEWITEFEFMASNFLDHKHDHRLCDLIVCWENDYLDCPLPVIALKDMNFCVTTRATVGEKAQEYWMRRCLRAESALKLSRAENAVRQSQQPESVFGDALRDRVQGLRLEGLIENEIAVICKSEGHSGFAIAKELRVKPSIVSQWFKGIQTDTDKRRLVVLDFYRSNPGVPYSTAADSLGLGKTTVYNDVKFWEKQGTIHVNGNGVEVKG